MKFNIHAGHNPDGKVACGAVGLMKESTEARKVVDKVITLLEQKGHTVYNCTCNNGINQQDVLKKIVTKCNMHKVDLDLSIHFNSGRNDYEGDGNTTGVEVCIHSRTSKSKPYAKKVCENISKLGYKNRGIKIRPELYVLKHTSNPAILIECCFVDDRDDVDLYDSKKMAQKIVDSILY
ncbi:N-acetylmuramoyl-L-alanine amidase [Anaeromicropila herbilytica]|uniref:MurNAc-LAA domain-containing protein n=1 Tax=Anaeromicropila herbilytica TaxID=2785025 RepID=A0A7R7ENV9_9FIRM|nr:N-acetylmuramoyl-L-alanine amidase [Anaeromicropila herbilytica]BCN32056.1 hypothetical protein bsdtb5_33510 [Anaeromicropila herbilytica]